MTTSLRAPLLILLGVLTLAGPAAAEDPADAMRRDDCARARAAGKVCELSMEAIGVEGDRPSGDGTGIVIAQWGKHRSLIRLRADFIVEILKTANDID
ncbi:MAG: hypothetical protein R2939_02490 [Kofleriaceae bacterium]